MKSVSAFEAKLLRCTRAIVSPPNLDSARSFAKSQFEAPPCMSRDAVSLLQDTLAKGVTLLLAREGWRPERFLRGDHPRLGRLWERTPPKELGLVFSRNTPALLCWLTASGFKSSRPAIDGVMTVGDALLAFLCYRLFRETTLATPLRETPMVRASALCRLFFPEDFPDQKHAVDWAMWTDGVGAGVVEAFEHSLTQRWIEIEREKSLINDRERMKALGAGQESALAGWLDAVAARRRRDLARFLVRAGGKLLMPGAAAKHWIGSLDVSAVTLVERTNLFRSAMVLLRHWRRLSEWTREAQAVGYFDDGYQAAQLWKADWEKFAGDEAASRAENILKEIEPLKPGSAT